MSLGVVHESIETNDEGRPVVRSSAWTLVLEKRPLLCDFIQRIDISCVSPHTLSGPMRMRSKCDGGDDDGERTEWSEFLLLFMLLLFPFSCVVYCAHTMHVFQSSNNVSVHTSASTIARSRASENWRNENRMKKKNPKWRKKSVRKKRTKERDAEVIPGRKRHERVRNLFDFYMFRFLLSTKAKKKRKNTKKKINFYFGDTQKKAAARVELLEKEEDEEKIEQ